MCVCVCVYTRLHILLIMSLTQDTLIQVTGVRLSHDNLGFGSGWLVDYVQVSASGGRQYMFSNMAHKEFTGDNRVLELSGGMV